MVPFFGDMAIRAGGAYTGAVTVVNGLLVFLENIIFHFEEIQEPVDEEDIEIEIAEIEIAEIKSDLNKTVIICFLSLKVFSSVIIRTNELSNPNFGNKIVMLKIVKHNEYIPHSSAP